MSAASDHLDLARERIAEALVDESYRRIPGLQARYGVVGRQRCLEDARHHLAYLGQALEADEPGIFVAYVQWGRGMLDARGVPLDDLVVNLEALAELLANEFEDDAAVRIVEEALAALGMAPVEQPSFLRDDAPFVDLTRDYLQAVLAGERHAAIALIVDAAAGGVPIRDIYLHVLQPTQWELGRLWQANEIHAGQEHLGTAVTQLAMSQLYPYLFRGERHERRMLATCVTGDLHELGIRMVADFFEMAGWDSTYLGANTPDDAVLALARELSPEVIAVSSTLPTHVAPVTRLIGSIRRDAQLAHTVVLVGGYPFNTIPELWKRTGADGTALDADQAVALATSILEARR